MDLLGQGGELAGPRIFPHLIVSPPNDIGALPSIGTNVVDILESILSDVSTWLIKRTYQPSIIRKRRKHGFLRRKESVGGRRVLKRRMAKGRMRLGGS
ncbi:hypothetical protein ACHAWF_001815 [Thalassiosira exigua]